jgi:hypothetical protein
MIVVTEHAHFRLTAVDEFHSNPSKAEDRLTNAGTDGAQHIAAEICA